MKHIKRITRKNCFEYHKEMLERGILICPECEARLSDQSPIKIIIHTYADIVYADARREETNGNRR